ncbi:hypothetical protein CLNEO_22260 [Anaerotignum neopropionicum]|uniref:Uncharacterized protein n=1 Tax=Anaerotignum neopropionicum TaxID=36847 RepID=A0A136WCP5_9FIRM|nr:hypothetical protein [Anaerotignum neopropionicum]KXL52292.1 hypothetical protein CLNEO_22260 [Anaerotignum neopropionicum]
MLRITEVNIYSMDKGDDSWAIDGEILFEDDLTSAFEATYLVDEDELESFSLELDLEENYDVRTLKKRIVEAANVYED